MPSGLVLFVPGFAISTRLTGNGGEGASLEFSLYLINEVLSELLILKITFLRIVEVFPTHPVHARGGTRVATGLKLTRFRGARQAFNGGFSDGSKSRLAGSWRWPS